MLAFGIIFIVITLQNVNVAKANPMYTEIPPKVSMPKIMVNASISTVDGRLWVEVNAEYQMHTIYGFGDSYRAQNTGMGLVVDPSPYVTVTVTQDILEAHYPTPSNATNISVKINNKETSWQMEKGQFHLFDDNLPQINWTIAPVPQDFNITVHYEQPISETTEAYSYLGDYAFTLPLYGRYGCSIISFPLYDWAGYPPTEYKLQIESAISNIDTYSINNRGTLTFLNTTTSTENGFEKIKTTFSHGENESTAIQGAVVVFNSSLQKTGNLPDVLTIVAFGVLAAVVAVGVIIFLRKRKNKDLDIQLNRR